MILYYIPNHPRGSVTQFYYQASFGQFLVKIDVYGPYTSDRSRQDRCYYGGIGDSAGSNRRAPMIARRFMLFPVPNSYRVQSPRACGSGQSQSSVPSRC